MSLVVLIFLLCSFDRLLLRCFLGSLVVLVLVSMILMAYGIPGSPENWSFCLAVGSLNTSGSEKRSDGDLDSGFLVALRRTPFFLLRVLQDFW